jgi:DNA-binding NarL/FixJ family response regulator
VQVGVSGYLGKIHKGGEIAAALQAVQKGQVYLCAEAASALAKDYRKKSTLAGSRLSEREKTILSAIADGQSTKEIAGALNVSVKTIETHRARIGEIRPRFGAEGEGVSIYVYDPEDNVVELKSAKP